MATPRRSSLFPTPTPTPTKKPTKGGTGKAAPLVSVRGPQLPGLSNKPIPAPFPSFSPTIKGGGFDIGKFFGDVGRNVSGFLGQKVPGTEWMKNPSTAMNKILTTVPQPPGFNVRAIVGNQDNSVVGGKPKPFNYGNMPLPGQLNGKANAGSTTDLYGGDSGPLSFADALAQAQGIIGGQGSVSYDPLRNQARSQWADADARTLAMSQELQGMIGGQADVLKKNYDEGIADTNEATQFANAQNQQSQKSLSDMKTQQAQALGIQDAVTNAVKSGDYAARDAAANTADTSARGQITSNQLIGNKTSALDFNSDLVGAAGLQGQMARMARQNELNRLLAGYDVQEQEANAQAGSSYQQSLLDNAYKIMGIDRDDRDTLSANERYATSEANDNEQFWAGLNAKSGGAGKWDVASAHAQALKEYGWTEKDLSDPDKRDKVLSRAMQYMKL